MGIFSIVTIEILPIGLLTPIGSSFHIPAGRAGWTMTVPGIVAAIAAPSVTVATRRLDRRSVLCGLMALLVCADFLAAVAADFWLLLLARALVGLTIGGFWSIGAGLVARLVPENSVARATAVIFSAVPLGSVLGVPVGTLIGQLAGWRTAFVVLGILTAGVTIALGVLLPTLPAIQATRVSVLSRLMANGNIRRGLLATFLVVIAHFGTYTYVTPFLHHVTHVRAAQVSTYLLLYGAAGVVGNFVAGSAIKRNLRGAFSLSAGMLAAATLLLPVIGAREFGAIAMLILWGLAYGAVPVCSQSWLANAAPCAPEAATVLFTSSFQATISIGALLGGVVVDASSTSTVMFCGGVAALAAAAVIRRS